MPKTKTGSTRSTTSSTRAKAATAKKKTVSTTAKKTTSDVESTKSNGRKKGFKKKAITISEDILSPFYIVKEDRQFVKMIKGNHIPQGYYTTLGSILANLTSEIVLERNASKTLSLRGYIEQYEQIQNEILKQVNI